MNRMMNSFFPSAGMPGMPRSIGPGMRHPQHHQEHHDELMPFGGAGGMMSPFGAFGGFPDLVSGV